MEQEDPELVEEDAYTLYVTEQTAAILTETAWLESLKAPAALTTVVGEVDVAVAEPVSDTDTLLQVIGKLQAQITALEARLEAVETPPAA